MTDTGAEPEALKFLAVCVPIALFEISCVTWTTYIEYGFSATETVWVSMDSKFSLVSHANVPFCGKSTLIAFFSIF